MSVRSLITALFVIALALPAHAALKVETARLGHGVEAWYAQSPSVPVVDVTLSFENAGYASDVAGKEGRAALGADMLTEGAGELDSLAFQRALEDKAISIDARATGDRLVIHIHALREHAKAAGELLALALNKPRLDEDALAREKAATTTRLTLMEEDPGYVADRFFQAQAFAGHPYASPPYGTASSVRNLSAQDLHDFFAAHLTRANLLVVASGDIDSGLLSDMLEPAIDGLPNGDVVAPAPVAEMQRGGETVRAPRNLPQSVIIFAGPGVKRDDPKFYAAYLLNQVIGGNDLVSRLASVIRVEKGLVYSVDSDLEITRGTALLRGALATREASSDAALTALKATLQELHDKGVTPEECTEARTYLLGSFPLQLDGTSSITSALLMMRIFDLGKDYLDKRAGYFSDVSCADVNAVAKELLDPSRFLFVVVGKQQAPAPTPQGDAK